MKKLYLVILLICCEFFAADMMAQLWVMAGRNTADPDGFSIVCTENVTSADIVYITENEYNNATNLFVTGENITKYTPPAGGHSKGEVVSFSETSPNTIQIDGCTSGTCGTVDNFGGTLNIGEIDALYVYSDSDDDPTNGVTEIYSVWFWNGSEGNVNGGDDPTGDFPDAEKLTIPGVIAHVDFKDALRSSDVTPSIYSNIGSSYDFNASANEVLSLTMFTTFSLPVDLVDFYATKKSGRVNLNWITASELNNDYFEVERSANGAIFELIGRTDGMGTTSTTTYYDFKDFSPIVGLNYYRLKQVDFDGKFEYSPIVVVDNKHENSNTVVYPNPFDTEITMELETTFNRDMDIRIYNNLGQIVSTSILAKGQSQKNINLSGLESGFYFLQIGEGVNAINQRIMKF